MGGRGQVLALRRRGVGRRVQRRLSGDAVMNGHPPTHGPPPSSWPGTLATGVGRAATALWVRRREQSGPQMFQVFNVNCTHLGCPVNWQAGAKLFLCPCHGGVFYSDGTVAGGPPPRPIFEREWQVSGDRLLVRQQPLP